MSEEQANATKASPIQYLALTAQQAQALVNYLQGQPYKDVHAMIHWLVTAPKVNTGQ